MEDIIIGNINGYKVLDIYKDKKSRIKIKCKCLTCNSEIIVGKVPFITNNFRCEQCEINKIIKLYENDWEIIQYDSGVRNGIDILADCKCKLCNNNQLIRRSSLKKNNKIKCKSCEQIYLNSQIGKVFNRLTVISYAYKKNYEHYFYCKCECNENKLKPVSLSCLLSGDSQSCGCLKDEELLKRNTKHGMTGTKFHNTYCYMKGRCYNKNNKRYDDYGGRGIYICDEWLNDFMNFYNDMYESYCEHIQIYGENNTSIDRVDNDGPYAPWNCKWSTMEEQSNNKSSNRLINLNNEILTISQIAKRYNLEYSKLYKFINYYDDIYFILNNKYNIPIYKNNRFTPFIYNSTTTNDFNNTIFTQKLNSPFSYRQKKDGEF